MAQPEFIGEFDLSPYPDGKTWFVINEVSYRCADGTLITVPAGRETDFASTPQVFWNVVPPWGQYGRAAIIHDECYWRQMVTRPRADAIFLEAMEVCGVPAWKRYAMYAAVRALGQYAWHDNQLIASQGYTRIGTRTSSPNPEWNKG